MVCALLYFSYPVKVTVHTNIKTKVSMKFTTRDVKYNDDQANFEIPIDMKYYQTFY